MSATPVTGWLRPPRLRPAEDGESERHATWLELFFDLVFVVAIAQLSTSLKDDHSLLGFFRFAALFVPVFWAWMGYTFYADRFDTDDVAFRAAMFLAMLTIAWMAVSIPGAPEGQSGRFALAYVAVRAVLIGLYERARRHVPAARALCAFYIRGFTAGTSIWLVSVFVPEPARFVLWIVGLALELSVPLLAGPIIRRTPFHASHIPERFGLFTLIVLGESVVLVATGAAGTDWSLPAVLAAAGCFAAVATLWWIYFDFVDTSVMKRSLWAGQTYVYGHLFILMGITAAGVGASLMIKEAIGASLSVETRWVLGGGIAMYLAAISAIHLTTTRSLHDSVLVSRLALAVIACILAAVGGALPPLVFLGALVAGLVADTIYEIALSLPPAPAHPSVPDLASRTAAASDPAASGSLGEAGSAPVRE